MIQASKISRGSEAIMQVGQKLFPGFNLSDPERRSKYEQMFYLLMDNDKVAEYGMKKGKGALLQGDIGVGKTMLMKTMQIVFRDTDRRFRWVNCMDFKDMLDDGMKASEIKAMYGRSFHCDLYIDDLGFGQSDYRSFGNVTNIISELIFERDEIFISEGYRTHFSSNIPTKIPNDIDTKSIERMYGDRALDRIKQLTNLIEWTGKSLRGQK